MRKRRQLLVPDCHFKALCLIFWSTQPLMTLEPDENIGRASGTGGMDHRNLEEGIDWSQPPRTQSAHCVEGCELSRILHTHSLSDCINIINKMQSNDQSIIHHAISSIISSPKAVPFIFVDEHKAGFRIPNVAVISKPRDS